MGSTRLGGNVQKSQVCVTSVLAEKSLDA